MGQLGDDHVDLGIGNQVGPCQVNARSPSFAGTFALALLSFGRWLSTSFTSSLHWWPPGLNPSGALHQIMRAVAIEARTSSVTLASLLVLPSVLAFVSGPTGRC